MNAIPVHDDIAEVVVEEVPFSSKLLSCLFAPLLPFIGCGFYTVDAKTEAAVLHMGQLTEMQNKPGLHCGWPCGREIRTISTKQSTMELPTSKVADLDGNPVMVSAILNYRVVDAKKALLHIENRAQYINTNAQAVLKQIVSQHSYTQQKSALVDARTLIVEGAVKIAQDAITKLEAEGSLELDYEQKARIVTNLLTVTCSDTGAAPTVPL